MTGDIGKGIEGLFYVLFAGTVFGLIFGTWKVIEICIWLYRHVSISWT